MDSAYAKVSMHACHRGHLRNEQGAEGHFGQEGIENTIRAAVPMLRSSYV